MAFADSQDAGRLPQGPCFTQYRNHASCYLQPPPIERFSGNACYSQPTRFNGYFRVQSENDWAHGNAARQREHHFSMMQRNPSQKFAAPQSDHAPRFARTDHLQYAPSPVVGHFTAQAPSNIGNMGEGLHSTNLQVAESQSVAGDGRSYRQEPRWKNTSFYNENTSYQDSCSNLPNTTNSFRYFSGKGGITDVPTNSLISNVSEAARELVQKTNASRLPHALREAIPTVASTSVTCVTGRSDKGIPIDKNNVAFTAANGMNPRGVMMTYAAGQGPNDRFVLPNATLRENYQASNTSGTNTVVRDFFEPTHAYRSHGGDCRQLEIHNLGACQTDQGRAGNWDYASQPANQRQTFPSCQQAWNGNHRSELEGKFYVTAVPTGPSNFYGPSAVVSVPDASLMQHCNKQFSQSPAEGYSSSGRGSQNMDAPYENLNNNAQERNVSSMQEFTDKTTQSYTSDSSLSSYSLTTTELRVKNSGNKTPDDAVIPDVCDCPSAVKTESTAGDDKPFVESSLPAPETLDLLNKADMTEEDCIMPSIMRVYSLANKDVEHNSGYSEQREDMCQSRSNQLQSDTESVPSDRECNSVVKNTVSGSDIEKYCITDVLLKKTIDKAKACQTYSTTDARGSSNASDTEQRAACHRSFILRRAVSSSLEEPRRKYKIKKPLVKFIRDVPIPWRRRKSEEVVGAMEKERRSATCTKPTQESVIRPRPARSSSPSNRDSKRPRLNFPESLQKERYPLPKANQKFCKKLPVKEQNENSLEDWLKSTRTAPHKIRAPIAVCSPVASDSNIPASDSDTNLQPVKASITFSENKTSNSQESDTARDMEEPEENRRPTSEPPVLLPVLNLFGGNRRRRMSEPFEFESVNNLAQEPCEITLRNHAEQLIADKNCWNEMGHHETTRENSSPNGIARLIINEGSESIKCKVDAEKIEANHDLRKLSEHQQPFEQASSSSSTTDFFSNSSSQETEKGQTPADSSEDVGKHQHENNRTSVSGKKNEKEPRSTPDLNVCENDKANLKNLHHNSPNELDGTLKAVQYTDKRRITNRDPRKAFLKKFPSFLGETGHEQSLKAETHKETIDKISASSDNLYSDVSDDEENPEVRSQSFGRIKSFESYFGPSTSMISILSLPQVKVGKEKSVLFETSEDSTNFTCTKKPASNRRYSLPYGFQCEVTNLSSVESSVMADQETATMFGDGSASVVTEHFQEQKHVEIQENKPVASPGRTDDNSSAICNSLREISPSLVETSNKEIKLGSGTASHELNLTATPKESLLNLGDSVRKTVTSKESQVKNPAVSKPRSPIVEDKHRSTNIKVKTDKKPLPKERHHQSCAVEKEDVVRVAKDGNGSVEDASENAYAGESRKPGEEITGSSENIQLSCYDSSTSKNIFDIFQAYGNPGCEEGKICSDSTESLGQSLSTDVQSCDISYPGVAPKQNTLVCNIEKPKETKRGYNTHLEVNDMINVQRLKRRRLVKRAHESSVSHKLNACPKQKKYRLIVDSSESSDEECFTTKRTTASQQNQADGIGEDFNQQTALHMVDKCRLEESGSLSTEHNTNNSSNTFSSAFCGGLVSNKNMIALSATVPTQIQGKNSKNLSELGEQFLFPPLIDKDDVSGNSLFEDISQKNSFDVPPEVETPGNRYLPKNSLKTNGEIYKKKTEMKMINSFRNTAGVPGIQTSKQRPIGQNILKDKLWKAKHFKKRKHRKGVAFDKLSRKHLSGSQLKVGVLKRRSLVHDASKEKFREKKKRKMKEVETDGPHETVTRRISSHSHLREVETVARRCLAQTSPPNTAKPVQKSKVRLGNWPSRDLVTVKSLKPFPLPITKQMCTSSKERNHLHSLAMQKLKFLNVITDEMSSEKNAHFMKSYLPVVNCKAFSGKKPRLLSPVTYRGKIGQNRWHTREMIYLRRCVVKLRKIDAAKN